ncbi:hypothetical protein Sango_0547500 [Sesamum angolense]|uniref:DUF4283 domain-containing protein n=1 Tax=Sesamum angolense TaxID=2727404 RepID=A0AAE2C1L0_9LAMI|nr:hypothetical protein Sango_0547500 [Sesamum angolense]
MQPIMWIGIEVAPLFPPLSGGRSPSDNPPLCRPRCGELNYPFDFSQRSLAGDGTLHLQPGRFPPLTRANQAESNSAKTASFHVNQPSETASSNSTNSIPTPQHLDFCKFFLANSKPPSIGATEEINGRPTIIFSDSETQSLVANFRLALIGKFSQGTPPYSQLHRLIAKSGIKGAFTKDALFAIANNIGTPLQIVDSTYNKSNLSKARVCVEIDLLKPTLEEIDIQICGVTIVQKIEYEQVPHYCSLCNHIGHQESECYSKGNAPKPPHNRQQKMKGKTEVQHARKVRDTFPVKNCPLVWMKKGESSTFVDALPAECEIIGKHYDDNAIMHVDEAG